MDFDLISEIREKETKSETEWVLLKYHSCLALISEVLVSESKCHISSEEAIRKIREHMNENL